MIRPDEIKQKALNLYPAWQVAWLKEESFFPRVIPCDKRLDENLAVAIESVHRLRAGSKETLGYGYAIEWKERSSRRHGRNRFPERILFETEEDFLRLIDKRREFSAFTSAVQRIRDRHPKLVPWIRSHRKELVEAAADLEGLLAVVDYFAEHPSPRLFARELPIAVDTKFIERHPRILRFWLDLVLPPHAIRADEDHFDRRFGLRYKEPLVFVRFLGAEAQETCGSPWSECAVPLHTLAGHSISCNRVLIVENKVNLLTLPDIHGSIAMGGLGSAVTDLRYLRWLADREVWYWGDIDVDGFEILSRLRTFLPQTRSMMMDEETAIAWSGSIGNAGNDRRGTALTNLTPAESLAYRMCADSNLRIEQERLPQEFVVDHLSRLFPVAQPKDSGTSA